MAVIIIKFLFSFPNQFDLGMLMKIILSAHNYLGKLETYFNKPVMCGSCHFKRALNDEFSVEF